MKRAHCEEGEGIGFWKLVSVVVLLAILYFCIDYGYNWYQNNHDLERIRAIEVIERLRQNDLSFFVEKGIDRLDGNLSLGRFTLKQVGSKGVEYEALRKRYFTFTADRAMKLLLDEAARDVFYWEYQPEMLIETIERASKKAGKSCNLNVLQDVLQGLKRTFYLTSARLALKEFTGRRLVQEVRYAVEKGGFSLSEVPITEQEMKATLAKAEIDEKAAVKRAKEERKKVLVERDCGDRYYYPIRPWSRFDNYGRRNYRSHGYRY